MATTQSNSKSNESVPTETTPSTGVSLREKAEEMYASYPESVEKREAVEAWIKSTAQLEALIATLNAKREAEEECCGGCHKHLVEGRAFPTEDGVYCKTCIEEHQHREEEEFETCEVCSEECNTEDIVGCCNDGDCPHSIENLCRGCGAWDEAKEVWRCPKCVEA